MGKKKVMLRAEEVDFTTVKYQYEKIEGVITWSAFYTFFFPFKSEIELKIRIDSNRRSRDCSAAFDWILTQVICEVARGAVDWPLDYISFEKRE